MTKWAASVSQVAGTNGCNEPAKKKFALWK